MLRCSSGIQIVGNGARLICEYMVTYTIFSLLTTGPRQARFAILQSFLSAEGFCEFKYTKDDLSDMTIHLDRNKIQSHGRPAVNDFLQKLHVFKSTADLTRGKELYDKMTHVDDWHASKLRPEIVRQAKPRKVFVQCNTVLDGDKVVLKEYGASPEGMIQSFVDREYI